MANDDWGKYATEAGRADDWANLNASTMPDLPSHQPIYRWDVEYDLIGEKAYDVTVQALNWYYDEGYFVGGSKGTSRGAPGLSPDGPGINYKDNWGSPHTEGVLFLFGDGGVRRVSFDTEPNIVAALLTPDGGELVPLP